MTIKGLLVERGYWPTILGPRSARTAIERDRFGTTVRLSKGTFTIDEPINLVDGLRIIGAGATIVKRGGE